jgi:RNA polymerase sigma factor (TIGR02999 family)
MALSGDDPDRQTRVSRTLEAASRAEPEAAAELLPLVYEELLALARSRMRRLPPGHTLQPTALVHEAYLKLAGERDPGWDGRRHFFGAAARAMRQILVDQARAKMSAKRGGDRQRLRLTIAVDHAPIFEAPVADVLSLDEALSRLEREDERKAQVVMLRYFVGMPSERIAETLDVSLATVERDWRFAKAWLLREMGAEALEAGGA